MRKITFLEFYFFWGSLRIGQKIILVHVTISSAVSETHQLLAAIWAKCTVAVNYNNNVMSPFSRGQVTLISEKSSRTSSQTCCWLTLKFWKMTGGGSTLFILAAFLTMASASCILPCVSSQRGDSGINLPGHTAAVRISRYLRSPKVDLTNRN